MITTQLNDIKTYLLAKYTSFNKGYANVSKPNQKNEVLDENEQQFAGINDQDGNFFYIRSLKACTYDAIKRGARTPYYKRTTQCRIVVIHHEANEEDIETILINSISSLGHTVTKIDTEKTRVFKEETGTDLPYKHLTLVSCDFEIVDTVSTKNCELNPCNC